MVSLVNSHTNATRIGWHLWEIDFKIASGLPPGWSAGSGSVEGPLRTIRAQMVCVVSEVGWVAVQGYLAQRDLPPHMTTAGP